MFYRILACFLGLVALSGCDKSPESGPRKPLVVILSPDNPPFEFKDTAHGDEGPIGFDVDVIKALEKRLGTPIEIMEADFGAIIPSLQSGRADMAISELNPTEERRKNVDFSQPYYVNKPALLVPNTSPIASEKELEGKKLGVQLGSTNENLARLWAIPGMDLISLNKVGELIQELKNGRIQAVLVGDRVAQNIARALPDIKIVPLTVSGGQLAIAFPKGSPLVGPVNEALQGMTEDLENMAKKWMEDK